MTYDFADEVAIIARELRDLGSPDPATRHLAISTIAQQVHTMQQLEPESQDVCARLTHSNGHLLDRYLRPVHQYPTCVICGERNVEDDGDHADTTGHWPVATQSGDQWVGERMSEVIRDRHGVDPTEPGDQGSVQSRVRHSCRCGDQIEVPADPLFEPTLTRLNEWLQQHAKHAQSGDPS